MPYPATMIANNVLERSFRDGVYVTPMALQKILYFAASEYEKRTGNRLLAEPFQTWAYGPVVRSVYDKFRPFAARDIARYAADASGEARVIDESLDPALGGVLDRVWQATKGRGPVDLARITRERGSAWFAAFQEGREFLDPSEVAADSTYPPKLELAEN